MTVTGLQVGDHNLVTRNTILSYSDHAAVVGTDNIISDNNLWADRRGLDAQNANHIVNNKIFGGSWYCLGVGSSNVVDANTIASRPGCDTSPHGIEVAASGNLVEGNNISAGDVGIWFLGGSNNNVYRNNVLFGYGTSAVLDEGTGNRDAGGNIQ